MQNQNKFKGQPTTYSYKKKKEQLEEILKDVPDRDLKVENILKIFGLKSKK